MSFQSDSEAIRGQLFDNWDVGNPVSPTPTIIVPNRADDKHNDEPWVELNIVYGERTPQSVVNGSVYGVGSIIIDIAVPLHNGEIIGLKLVDHIKSIFSNIQFGNNGNIWTDSTSLNAEGFVKNNFYIIKTETIFHVTDCNN